MKGKGMLVICSDEMKFCSVKFCMKIPIRMTTSTLFACICDCLLWIWPGADQSSLKLGFGFKLHNFTLLSFTHYSESCKHSNSILTHLLIQMTKPSIGCEVVVTGAKNHFGLAPFFWLILFHQVVEHLNFFSLLSLL